MYVRVKSRFVFWRGTLATILKTPYMKIEEASWIICAAKWKGTIYLTPYHTEFRQIDKASWSPRRLRSLYWGLKFRQHVLTGFVIYIQLNY